MFQSMREAATSNPAPEILTVDPDLLAILAKVSVIAGLGESVLIVGETGTGKELIARKLHADSAHRDAPFLARNMAALTAELANSELFGHLRGAFTGATCDRAGIFEIAGAGTVFLDEVGEMAPDVQAGLLRVLENREYQRVGDSRSRPFAARIVAATNVDPQQAISAGRFREDLFQRLSFFTVSLPPLRARRGDIELLARHFLRQACRECERELEDLEPEAMRRLLAYPFPGNVRELRNIIGGAAPFESGPRLSTAHFPPAVRVAGVGRRGKYLKRCDALAHLRGVLEKSSDLRIARAKSEISRSQFYKLAKSLRNGEGRPPLPGWSGPGGK